ncbi:MAG: dihydrofolate reductase family protein [Actinomycetota bacterium]
MAGKLYAGMSMSLDGYIAGPNDGPDNGLGDGGDQLHEWIYGLKSWREPHRLEGGETNQDDAVMKEAFERAGAFIMGRRMFDNAEEAWGDEPPFQRPVFVLTHRAREPLAKKGGTTFTFVTDGIESALSQAREAAGGKDVAVAGANAIQQYINTGLLDEIEVDLVPISLGGGVPLFANIDDDIRFEKTRIVDSPAVTHLWYRVVKEGS